MGEPLGSRDTRDTDKERDESAQDPVQVTPARLQKGHGGIHHLCLQALGDQHWHKVPCNKADGPFHGRAQRYALSFEINVSNLPITSRYIIPLLIPGIL